MSIRTRTETKKLEPQIDPDLLGDPDDDDDRETALENAFLGSQEFDGVEMRPVTIGSLTLLQRAGNKLFFGDASNSIFDVGAFVLIHGEDTAHEARRAIINGGGIFDEMVYDFLDRPGMQRKIISFQPVIESMLAEYTKTETIEIGSGEGAKKKRGNRAS